MADSKAKTKQGDVSPQVPRHVGFIVDGNRRWAEEHKVPKHQGHRVGADVVKKIADHTLSKGVKFVSFYIFSTENWKRTQEEIEYLMELVLKLATTELAELDQKGYRALFLGSEEGVSPKIIKAIRNAEKTTKDNTNGTVVFCFNYGGYKEIVDATRQIIDAGIKANEVTEETIERHLYLPDVPAVDLMIRTSGEMRISNFMLWRIAYSEFVFEDINWPDFTEEHLDKALDEYARRNRRFGADKPSK